MSFWDDRFSSEEYVYGKEANRFLKSELDKLTPGKILFPAEGEGRNAVYAAGKGWKVDAFDSSIEGRKKALKLAGEMGTEINYQIASYKNFSFEGGYDAVALCFTHLAPPLRQEVHKQYIELLKPGGHIIMQAFRKEQLGLDSGGPRELDLLFSKEELESDFSGLSNLKVWETEEDLEEGPYHRGFARLINLVGVK